MCSSGKLGKIMVYNRGVTRNLASRVVFKDTPAYKEL